MQSEVKQCITPPHTTSLPPTDFQSGGHLLQKLKEASVMQLCRNSKECQVCHCSTHLHLQIACSHTLQRTWLHKCAQVDPPKEMGIEHKTAFLKHSSAFRWKNHFTYPTSYQTFAILSEAHCFLLGGSLTQNKCSPDVKPTNRKSSCNH